MSSGAQAETQQELSFELSPIPSNPLGQGRFITTAAVLIIGDEILNGKTSDTNSYYFARFCFQYGINLKRIEVISDNEDEIVEAARRLVSKYDLVVTSGGIGPTHDDITYESIAKAFNQPLTLHEEALRRFDMANLAKYGTQQRKRTAEQREAFKRMAIFPTDAETLFVKEDLCVPVVRVAGKLCILPGVPTLFERLIDALPAYLPLPPSDQHPLRLLVYTSQPESSIAPYLTLLQKRLSAEEIQVGSYPKWGAGVSVSLVGRNHERVREIAVEVEREVEGKISVEGTQAAQA